MNNMLASIAPIPFEGGLPKRPKGVPRYNPIPRNAMVRWGSPKRRGMARKSEVLV